MGWMAGTSFAYGSWEPRETAFEVSEPAGYEGEWVTLLPGNQRVKRHDRPIHETRDEALQEAGAWPPVQHSE